MGVVTVSSSAAQTPLGLSSNFSTYRSQIKRPILIVAFKSDKSDTATTTTTSLVPSIEKAPLPLESPKEKKLTRKGSKHSKRVKALATDVSPCPVELDYNEAAAKLENLYKLSTAVDVEVADVKTRRGRQVKRKSSTTAPGVEEDKKIIVKSRAKKVRRLSLKKRIELKNAEEGVECSNWERKGVNDDEREKINSLLRDHSASTDLVSLDWKKMKIPPVLPAVEHTWLFTLMQPMKALMQVKGQLATNLGREPTEPELAEATNTNVFQLRKDIEVGHAARNKLIKHNLRLILFVINKYFQDFANSPKFQDLCQEGVKGLITAIDRFEPKRKFRLSTYALFWIRHAIIRSMTLSSFTRVSFGLESIRVEIQKTKLELLFELQRQPTEEEIIQRVGISPERYREVMRATKPVISLHSRNATTQEELINCITDVNGGDTDRQPALIRLALDDVLDSLKPKESLVIRQRYGLDGKGDRTLGEIAGNLNISREMVRKYEVKALMKLKLPVRVDYLRRYAV